MKHLSVKTKREYVQRYMNGEDVKSLSQEVAVKYGCKQKSPQNLIFKWKRQYNAGQLDDKYVKKTRGKGKSKLPPKDYIYLYNNIFTKDEIIYFMKKI